MRKILFLYLFTIIIETSLIGANKFALIIAAWDYERLDTKWGNLSSANDANMIRDALVARGFMESNIVILKQEVTKENIINTFNNSLLDKASKGDIIFFHYSGHGNQIPDNNNDELDEFDESLVPEDAPFDKGKQYPEAYYENYIRDDELAVMLDLLRSKVGVTGNVFVTIDANFGSMREEVREKSINFIPPPSARVENSNDDFGLYNSGDNKSPMICILASSEEELNYEYQVSDSLRVGSLSFAFSKALTETNNNVSYRVLFEKIKNIMVSIAPRQTPHAEGEFDQLIFGGQLLSRTSYLKIKDILNNKRVIINGGILHGILPGTIVGFYPPDTRDLSSVKAIAVGKVLDNRIIESTIELTEGELSSDKDYLTWVFILEKN